MLKEFKKSAALFLALGALPIAVHATEIKNARSNDVAQKYILEDNGDLYRIVNGYKCQITDRVESFKVSQHPNDIAMIYYKRDGDLYILRNSASYGQCPIASKKIMMRNIKKYNVVSNTKTTIVNMALSHNGQYTAWDNNYVVFKAKNIEDYSLHGKYGVAGAPFNSYVVFAIDTNGRILKVKGQNPESSKFDHSQYFNSLSHFKQKNGID